MRPTPRDWLGAGALALILVVLILVLVATAMGPDEAARAALGAVA